MGRSSVISLVSATSAEKARFRRSLLKWFDANQRDLPWRKKRTPYRIWISEIMLQQTQVATVIDYYLRFMKRFPSVADLAAADQSEVLKLWEGLGYYRRARQLHAAARQVVEYHGGEFPTTFDDVLALPGIGRYTAGAILSISQDQPHPILEGNTVRLFARLMKLKSDPKSSATLKQLWAFSESILPRKRAGDFNQALMELGSEVCKPKATAQCCYCPVIKFCPTFASGLQATIPANSKKVEYENLHEAVVLVSRSDNSGKLKFLIRQCGEEERWTGLWDFPRFVVSGQASRQAEELSDQVYRLSNLKVIAKPANVRIKHAVTRFRITLDVFLCSQLEGRLNRKHDQTLRWANLSELEQLPMSVTGRKIVQRCCK